MGHNGISDILKARAGTRSKLRQLVGSPGDGSIVDDTNGRRTDPRCHHGPVRLAELPEVAYRENEIEDAMICERTDHMKLSRRARTGRPLTTAEREAEFAREMLRVDPTNSDDLLSWDDGFALDLLVRIAKAAYTGGMSLAERDRLARKLRRITRRAELVRAGQGVRDPWLPEDAARALREFARPVNDIAGLARWLEPREPVAQ